MDILFLLILGHLIGDYALQTDRMAKEKKDSKATLSLHVLTYVLCIWAMLMIYHLLYNSDVFISSATIIFIAALYAQHWIQDFLKSRLKSCDKQVYYLDQVLHLGVLYLYRLFIFPG